MSFLTDCAVLPDHVENECAKYLKGGFPSFAVVDKDHTITDWSNATQWQTNITAGKVKIVNRIKANIPEPSPIMSDNPVACGAVQILDGFDWKLEIMDAQRSVFNDEFYKTLNNKTGYLVLWNKDESKVIVVDKEVSNVAFPVYPPATAENQFYTITGAWTSSKDWFPTTAVAPAGVFTF
jgi:hypothetical protein